MPYFYRNNIKYSGGSDSVDLTMAEYKELEANGKVVQDTTYYIIDADENIPSRPNLLINSNFANPVNQRGITAETWIPNRYGIDRWITDMTFSSITNGLTIGSLGTTGFLSQRFEEGTIVNGKKYSFSICIDGVIYNGTNTADNSKGMVFVNNDIIKAYIDYSTDNDYWYLGLEFKIVGVTIEWAKLELGEYATPYAPRLYAEELQLCQRYYQHLDPMHAVILTINTNEIHFCFDIPFEMRLLKPNVTFATDTIRIDESSRVISGFTYSLAYCNTHKHVARVVATKASHGYTRSVNNPTMYTEVIFNAEIY